MSRALIVQHLYDDGPCLFEELLHADGFSLEALHLHDGQPVPNLDDFDLMMVLGGPQDVWQTQEHPWLLTEENMIREWVVDKAKPYIGICLGHQLLASALGGSVERAEQKEIGLHHMQIDPDTGHRFFDGLKGEYPVMQWHQAEVTALPEGGQVLASSPAADVQALAVGENALGVQFHFEWTLDWVKNWPDSWKNALESELGEGAHAQVVRDATSHMAGFNEMTRQIYRNFKQVNGF